MESGKIAEFDGINKMSKFCERFDFMEEKAFIFDMDGVIIDSENLHSVTKVQAIRSFGVEVSEADLNLQSYVAGARIRCYTLSRALIQLILCIAPDSCSCHVASLNICPVLYYRLDRIEQAAPDCRTYNYKVSRFCALILHIHIFSRNPYDNKCCKQRKK